MTTRNRTEGSFAEMLTIFLFIVGSVAFSCSPAQTEQPTRTDTPGAPGTKTPPASAHLPYQILRQWSPGGHGIGMEILVSEKATKEQVLELGRFLRKDNGDRPFIMIHIFDSKIAWQRRDDESYPEKEYFKHFLAAVSRNSKTGFDKIEWHAKGRDH